VRLPDPDVGDTLTVVTALGPAKGLPARRDYVQMALLASVQGLAVEPRIGTCAAHLREHLAGGGTQRLRIGDAEPHAADVGLVRDVARADLEHERISVLLGCVDHRVRLETDGMGTEKIAQFYSDRDKLAADRHSLQLARFRGYQLHFRLPFVQGRLNGIPDARTRFVRRLQPPCLRRDLVHLRFQPISRS